MNRTWPLKSDEQTFILAKALSGTSTLTHMHTNSHAHALTQMQAIVEAPGVAVRLLRLGAPDNLRTPLEEEQFCDQRWTDLALAIVARALEENSCPEVGCRRCCCVVGCAARLAVWM